MPPPNPVRHRRARPRDRPVGCLGRGRRRVLAHDVDRRGDVPGCRARGGRDPLGWLLAPGIHARADVLSGSPRSGRRVRAPVGGARVSAPLATGPGVHRHRPLAPPPPTQRLAMPTELRRDDGQPAVGQTALHTPLADQAHRPLPDLVGVAPRSCRGLDPSCTEWRLNPGRFSATGGLGPARCSPVPPSGRGGGRLRPMSRASGLRVVAVCRGGREHTAERLRGPEQTG